MVGMTSDTHGIRSLSRFHREHPLSHVNTPLTAFSTSVPECLGWIVGYALVPLLLTALAVPVHPLGFLAYLIYNFGGNIIGHVNVEPFPRLVGETGGLRSGAQRQAFYRQMWDTIKAGGAWGARWWWGSSCGWWGCRRATRMGCSALNKTRPTTGTLNSRRA